MKLVIKPESLSERRKMIKSKMQRNNQMYSIKKIKKGKMKDIEKRMKEM